ncbi:MAG: DUF1638 domain-containing protein [Deltaproteobacteria bacterium]|nr:DUF1638 domain-containing protein [Deltaproteobacteria bacterium]
MAKIGIITCQILELEFAHVLSADTEVSDVFVVDNEFSAGLLSELKDHGKKPVHRLTTLKEFGKTSGDGHQVLIRVMEVGLHSVTKNLQRHVVSAVEEMAQHVESVLLGYGLCGNALDHAKDLFSEVGVPVMLPMDEDHPVDDCVGLIIGGRENYYARQCECAGTMFMNAGFSRHWRKILDSDIPEELLPKKDMLLKRMMRDYERSLLLPTKVLGEIEMMANIEAFNAKFGLRTESTPGTLALLEKAWQEAKNRSAEKC